MMRDRCGGTIRSTLGINRVSDFKIIQEAQDKKCEGQNKRVTKGGRHEKCIKTKIFSPVN